MEVNMKLKLSSFFLTIAEWDRHIEVIRQVLNSINSFEPYAAFLRLTNGRGSDVTAYDIVVFMEENRIRIDKRGIRLFVRLFDTRFKGCLDFEDFLRMILSRDNPDNRLDAALRPTFDVGNGEFLSDEVEYTLTRFFTKACEFLTRILVDEETRFVIEYPHFFDQLDFDKTGFIDFGNLCLFFKNSKIRPRDSEIIAMLRIIDINDDGKVTKIELEYFLSLFSGKEPSGLMIEQLKNLRVQDHKFNYFGELADPKYPLRQSRPSFHERPKSFEKAVKENKEGGKRTQKIKSILSNRKILESVNENVEFKKSRNQSRSRSPNSLILIEEPIMTSEIGQKIRSSIKKNSKREISIEKSPIKGIPRLKLSEIKTFSPVRMTAIQTHKTISDVSFSQSPTSKTPRPSALKIRPHRGHSIEIIDAASPQIIKVIKNNEIDVKKSERSFFNSKNVTEMSKITGSISQGSKGEFSPLGRKVVSIVNSTLSPYKTGEGGTKRSHYIEEMSVERLNHLPQNQIITPQIHSVSHRSIVMRSNSNPRGGLKQIQSQRTLPTPSFPHITKIVNSRDIPFEVIQEAKHEESIVERSTPQTKTLKRSIKNSKLGISPLSDKNRIKSNVRRLGERIGESPDRSQYVTFDKEQDNQTQEKDEIKRVKPKNLKTPLRLSKCRRENKMKKLKKNSKSKTKLLRRSSYRKVAKVSKIESELQKAKKRTLKRKTGNTLSLAAFTVTNNNFLSTHHLPNTIKVSKSSLTLFFRSRILFQKFLLP